MDVRSWYLIVKKSSDNYDSQPGLALCVSVECRVCGNVGSLSYARTLTPRTVKDGYPFNGPGSDRSWFKFSVNDRIGTARHCQECGTASIVPPRQREHLITVADEALDIELLRQAVVAMGFTTERLPENQDHYAYDVYRAGIRDSFTLTAMVALELPPTGPDCVDCKVPMQPTEGGYACKQCGGTEPILVGASPSCSHR